MYEFLQHTRSFDGQRHGVSRYTAIYVAVFLSMLTSFPVQSQIVVNKMPLNFTLEAYGNITTGATNNTTLTGGQAPDAVSFDGAARVLVAFATPSGPNVGLRVVAEASNREFRVSEVSALLFGSAGRLEIGKRMGLPDVLTGYAPNSFTFTVAEFGPPTGRSLDPGGGLQTQFLRGALRMRLEPIASQGVTASQFNDQSTKVLYVLPKNNGWLGGVSFATNAEDSRFDRLAQVGVVHESYWHQNVWRWGGTYAHARADQGGQGSGLRNLDSVGLGTSLTLDDSLDIGIAASYDGLSGTPRGQIGNDIAPAWGATASINYNSGPWTVGGYYQRARTAPVGIQAGNDRLSAFELGASYRFTTRLRLYGAWFFYDLANSHRDPVSGRGSVFTLGFRATL